MDDARIIDFAFRSNRPGDYGLIGGLGAGVLFPWEDPAVYAAIQADVFAFIDPVNCLEVEWAAEYVNHCWWLRRFRIWEPAIVMASAGQGLEAVLRGLLDDPDQAAPLSRRWARGEAVARTEVADLLKTAGFEPHVITAMSFVGQLPSLAMVQRMIIDREKRRDQVHLTIERSREAADRRRWEAGNYADSGPTAYPRYIEQPSSDRAPPFADARLKRTPE